ncbi:hypothetical protein F3Y22_tig00117000pilonHSYRG00230 [Hibiscus syriacus]|uniref:Uncharacterized protein n=1 Tax=Hibiscus syriacus TaxID=106335 RepID=A0A6A2XRL0_HIBSY|nr:hypothetical protein F3Y22_tig00117000pilonHSYRG00230 [Hibiscus syriacus]
MYICVTARPLLFLQIPTPSSSRSFCNLYVFPHLLSPTTDPCHPGPTGVRSGNPLGPFRFSLLGSSLRVPSTPVPGGQTVGWMLVVVGWCVSNGGCEEGGGSWGCGCVGGTHGIGISLELYLGKGRLVRVREVGGTHGIGISSELYLGKERKGSQMMSLEVLLTANMLKLQGLPIWFKRLVKAGYGSKVAPFIEPATVVDVTKENKNLSPSFSCWLAERNLSRDDCTMPLKERYIQEGSTVVVMGIVRRHDNVLMIVSLSEPISTGCQWSRCFLPTYVEGLILTCDDNQNVDVVPL